MSEVCIYIIVSITMGVFLAILIIGATNDQRR